MFIGQIVRLKSGSPELTVVGLDEVKSEADVSWFDDEDGLQTATFSTACLVSVGFQEGA
jgi:uncharacterized protein YodC (DUF2158 family)